MCLVINNRVIIEIFQTSFCCPAFKGERMKKKFFSKAMPYLFILPSMILIVLFFYYAIFLALRTSVMDSHAGYQETICGLMNYKKLFTDNVFLVSLRNQVMISVLGIFNNIFFPLLAAEILFFITNKKWAAIARGLFVIPMLIPSIVNILTWKYLYNPRFGFNTFFQMIGKTAWEKNWLNSPDTALWAVILMINGYNSPPLAA
jgi:raffinose/stachyose/melibiose transport system permease protein